MSPAIIETLRDGVSRFMLHRGGLLGLVTLVLHAWLAPAHIVDGDNAEFATLGAIGGTAHPSGYPLYLLWLRAMQWLPGSSPAHTAALATTLIAALGALTLHAACRAWGARPLAATIAVALFLAAPVVLRISTEAEVFALNNLIVATVLWLAATKGPLRGTRRTAALALVAGLGLANHMTCVLVAPIGVLGAVRGIRESDRPAIAAAAAIGALVVGLSPYAYLIATVETPLSWGKVEGLSGVLAMITRQDYGGPGSFLPTSETPSIWDQLAALGATLGRSWLVIGALGALVVLGLRIARPAGETRSGWLLLAVSFIAAGPILVSRFNVAPTGLGLYVCQRFYVLPILLLAIPFAAGLDQLVARFDSGRAIAVASTLGLAAAAGLALPHLARVHTPAVEDYARNLLRVMPADAVLFSGGDTEYLGMGYVQWALGERQDVVVIAPQLTTLAWYRARIERRGMVAPAGEGLPIVRLIEKLIAEGRPVFVESAREEVISALPTYPFATVMKVLPRGAATPPIDAVIAENEALYAKFTFRYRRPGSDDEFATQVHRRYASTWNVLGRKAQSLGQPALATRAFAIANEIGPRP